MTAFETAVIGGGPAGAATACALALAGREVLLLEREAGPHHKVCGEFLSVETQALLAGLGIDPAALGAVAVERVSIHTGARCVSAALPFRALSLSRYRFDDALLRRAAACGVQIRRAVSVRQAARAHDGWALQCGDEPVTCRNVVLATGKRGLRGLGDERDTSLVGLKMHLRLTPAQNLALAGGVELVLLPRGYAGLELVENGIANLCLVLPRAAVAALAPGWAALHAYLIEAAPHLAGRLAGAAALWEKPLAVVCPAGGHLTGEEEPGAYRVGDRLAHIPPFTGDGLAIALGSAALAAGHIRRGEPPAAYRAAARRLIAKPIGLAARISGLAANGAGRAALIGAATCAPWLIDAVVRRTRLAGGAGAARGWPLTGSPT
jgi:flavin-dependent dehydrogenase